MKSFQLLFILFITSISLIAQDSSDINTQDEHLIKQTIETYFEGWLTGDTLKVGSAMHTSCHLKYVIDDGVAVIDRNTYLSRFKPRPKLENAEGRIITLDITRTAAAAECELETPTRLFTDYFNLLKIKGRWYITDKVSTSILK